MTGMEMLNLFAAAFCAVVVGVEIARREYLWAVLFCLLAAWNAYYVF